MQLERRRDLANGRQGRFQAACRLGFDLPAQAKSDKSQGVRGTESPDSINQTLKKTEKHVSVFSGEVHPIECSKDRLCNGDASSNGQEANTHQPSTMLALIDTLTITGLPSSEPKRSLSPELTSGLSETTWAADDP